MKKIGERGKRGKEGERGKDTNRTLIVTLENTKKYKPYI
jgi:hypothetical protein